MGKKRKKCLHDNRMRRVENSRLSNEVKLTLDTAVRLHKQGNLQQAEMLYKAVLRVDPENSDAFHLLGVMAQQNGMNEAAVPLMEKAISLKPDVAEYHYNLAVALQELDMNGEAAEAYRRAVALRPDHSKAYENLGVALQDCGDWDGAMAAYLQAIKLDDRSLLALNNAGTCLMNSGRIREAEEYFRRALSVQPVLAAAHVKLSHSLVATGRLTEGWTEYEWRYLSEVFLENNLVNIVPYPRWDGSPLQGKTILVTAEQGIGDEVMFGIFLPELISKADHVVIECDRRLRDLFQRSFPKATVRRAPKDTSIYCSTEPVDIDCRIPMGSLPHFYHTDNVRAPSLPYLAVDENLRRKWRQRLNESEHDFHVGVSWRGGANPRSREARSIPLAMWANLFALDGVNFINLQYGDHAAEVAEFHKKYPGRLITFAEIDPIADLDGFAALIGALDLVISIDNSTVHFAGAIGTPTWLLLPCGAEWRWLTERLDSIWYKSLKLYRNSQPGREGWPAMLRRVESDLTGLVEQQSKRESLDNSQLTALTVVDETMAGHREEDSSRSFSQRGASGQQGRVLLLNDTTAWYHWGCSCTSIAIHEQLRKRFSKIRSIPINQTMRLAHLPVNLPEFDDERVLRIFTQSQEGLVCALNETDVVYINGEGTLHGLSRQALGMLYLAYVAKVAFDIPVHIINHSCYPDDTATVKDSANFQLYRKVYEAVDFIAVRERVSSGVLEQMGIGATQSFDCLPLFIDRHYAVRGKDDMSRNVVIAGSVAWGGGDVSAIGDCIRQLRKAGFNVQVLFGANAYPAADDLRFIDTLHQQCSTSFELVYATSEMEWLRVIDAARLLISGRFHHSIAAAFLDTPFIVMESNTPKIEGMMAMLELDNLVSVSDPDLANTLYQQAIAMMTKPESFLVQLEVKRNLKKLALKNFLAQSEQ